MQEHDIEMKQALVICGQFKASEANCHAPEGLPPIAGAMQTAAELRGEALLVSTDSVLQNFGAAAIHRFR